MARNRETYTTPIGAAVWPSLHTPDTRFDEAGVYSTKLRFEGADAATVSAFLDEQYEQSRQEAAADLIERGKAKTTKAALAKVKEGPDPYTQELDEETGEETGAILVNFKMKASGTRKKDGTTWTARPRLFDAQGNPVTDGLKVGSGSRLRINAEVNRYYVPALGAGVSLRLVAVQVIELQTFGRTITAESAGFDAVEGGFSADDADESVFAGMDDSSTSDDIDESDDSEEGGDFDGGDF